jgi:GTPase SAR1 family protein
VVLLGNSAAGKTSLLQRFTHDAWDASTNSTIGAAFSSHIVVRPAAANLQQACGLTLRRTSQNCVP